jgi:AcrR family transcriptional regulator
MARWAPGTAERLQRAAFDLFAQRGYEQTTAREIAQSVGLTERTFFRHFSDKREVLFHGQDAFVQAFLDGVESAPPDAAAIDGVAAALRSATSWFPDERRSASRARQLVIDQNPALSEREAQKLATLSTTIAGALRARGVAEPAATLAAQSGVNVFGIAFSQWLAEGEERSLEEISDAVLDELLSLARRD